MVIKSVKDKEGTKDMNNFTNEKELANFVSNLGGDLWLVGGSIRDKHIGLTPKDKDYVITKLDINKLPFEKIAGKDFPVFVVKVKNKLCEVALARKEKKEGTGYKGFNFFTSPSISIEEDLSRRDLTINSMAQNVITNKIVDPFNGLNDLKNGVLRHTTNSFSEDPLRVFRTAHFAARFNFKILDNTKELMKSLVNELEYISIERVWFETMKVLNTKNPSIFFTTLKEINALSIFFKEIDNLNVSDKHDGTTFSHTMKLIDKGVTPLERFGLLVHDLGKGITPKELHPSHYNHDKLGEKVVEDFCKKLKIPNDFRKFGMLCAKEHMRIKNSLEMKDSKFFVMASKLGKNTFRDLLNVSLKDSSFREGSDFEVEKIKFDKILEKANKVWEAEKEITGKTLIKEGKKPGKNFKDILFQRRLEVFKKA